MVVCILCTRLARGCCDVATANAAAAGRSRWFGDLNAAAVTCNDTRIRSYKERILHSERKYITRNDNNSSALLADGTTSRRRGRWVGCLAARGGGGVKTRASNRPTIILYAILLHCTATHYVTLYLYIIISWSAIFDSRTRALLLRNDCNSIYVIHILYRMIQERERCCISDPDGVAGGGRRPRSRASANVAAVYIIIIIMHTILYIRSRPFALAQSRRRKVSAPRELCIRIIIIEYSWCIIMRKKACAEPPPSSVFTFFGFAGSSSPLHVSIA